MKKIILSLLLCFSLSAFAAELHQLVKSGTVDQVREYLDQHPGDVNHEDSFETTALSYACYACEASKVKIVGLLLDRGAKSPFEPIEAKEFLKAHTNPSQSSIEGARSEVVQLLKDRNII